MLFLFCQIFRYHFKVCFVEECYTVYYQVLYCLTFSIALRILSAFVKSSLEAASRPIFKVLNILPIPSTIFSLNIILAHKTLESPKSVQETLGLLHRQNPFPTRSADIKLLERPTVRTINFGYKSIRYRNVDLSICSTSMIKQFISKILFSFISF